MRITSLLPLVFACKVTSSSPIEAPMEEVQRGSALGSFVISPSAGGAFTHSGLSITVDAGSVTEDTTIFVSIDDEGAPGAKSSVFLFWPKATRLINPALVTIDADEGDALYGAEETGEPAGSRWYAVVAARVSTLNYVYAGLRPAKPCQTAAECPSQTPVCHSTAGGVRFGASSCTNGLCAYEEEQFECPLHSPWCEYISGQCFQPDAR